MSCFVSQYNAFRASDFKCGLLFIGKIHMYIVSTVEHDLYHAAYGVSYLLIKKISLCCDVVLSSKNPHKTKPLITVKQLCFSCLFFFFLSCLLHGHRHVREMHPKLSVFKPFLDSLILLTCTDIYVYNNYGSV